MVSWHFLLAYSACVKGYNVYRQFIMGNWKLAPSSLNDLLFQPWIYSSSNITYLYLSNKFPRCKLSEGVYKGDYDKKKNGNTELIKERRIWRMHANGSEAFSCQRPSPICIARCLLSYRDDLPEDLGKTIALPKYTKKSTSGWRASLKNTFAY